MGNANYEDYFDSLYQVTCRAIQNGWDTLTFLDVVFSPETLAGLSQGPLGVVLGGIARMRDGIIADLKGLKLVWNSDLRNQWFQWCENHGYLKDGEVICLSQDKPLGN
ncbi:hypothetical protein [Sulfobacillus thermosulfidooxidans]|uniref:hypothetical protein n=1 Tax=Sulfobacillus thermosulfidooxidans TaxID=28034 RepID=UPI0006B56A13|nr:hypothetical protein [Sulfobacillus thermosulfidooxidans]